jgi:DNA-binding protein H-NS
MQKIDFSGMTIPELDALRSQLNETLTAKIEAEEAAIQERLAALAAIKGGRKPVNGGKAEPTHCDPVTGQTWAGRGQPPTWLTDYEKEGRKRDEFLIRAAKAA